MTNDARELLPIRLFTQRTVDEKRVEGGPRDESPAWVLAGEALEERAKSLRDGLTDEWFLERHNPDLPYTFEVVLDNDDTVKSKRGAVVDMLSPSGSGSSYVVGMRGATGLILRLPTRESVELVASRMNEPDRYGAPITCVLRIGPFRPEVDAVEEGIFKVKLLRDRAEDGDNAGAFSTYLDTLGIEHKLLSYSKGMVIYKAAMKPDEVRAVVDGSLGESIFSIKPMPKLSAVLDGIAECDVPPVRQPVGGGQPPLLGILDSGVKEIGHLAPWLGDSMSPYPLSDMDRSHGTFVAGIAVYGDELEGREWVGGLPPQVFSACVIPDPRAMTCNEDELVDNIREAIAKRSEDVKVWNLSVSIDSPVSSDDFSDFAMALDEIQDEYGVLICKSAGNCMGFARGKGKSPLSAGADSVRALTVGSVAQAKGEWDEADEGEASPFTRCGPGPQFIIKPEVCHYGGNAGVCPDGSVCQSGVRSFDLDGGAATACGTSFSTPRVSALASNLALSLDGKFDPLLVKALIVHSASFPGDLVVPRDEKVKEMGFGVPSDVRRMLIDEPYEATLVLNGELPKGEIIDIIDFPMPESLVEDGYFRGQIILTLVCSPVLDPLQGGEYCQSDIDVKLGTYDDICTRDTTKPTILNPIGRTNPSNLLLSKPYSKRNLKKPEESFALRERMLIEYGGKYYPVKKYAIDFADLTPANRKLVAAGRKWFMYLRGTYRDAAERRALRERKTLSQEFCVLVTIRDPRREAFVYNDVASFLDLHGFWHQTVPISNTVRASLRGIVA